MSDSAAPSNGGTSPNAALPDDLSEHPSRVRYGVLAFLAAMAFILYLDRACINQAATRIKEEMGISDTQLAVVFGAFALSYGLFEIPAGWWGDRFGSRRILRGSSSGGRCSRHSRVRPGDSVRSSSFDSCSGPGRLGPCRTRRGCCAAGSRNRREVVPRGL